MKTLTARDTLDRHYLEMRAKLIEVAASLDRIDRGGAVDDPRLGQLRQAIEVLQQAGDGRAEKLQLLFSLPYDSEWGQTFGVPKPRA